MFKNIRLYLYKANVRWYYLRNQLKAIKEELPDYIKDSMEFYFKTKMKYLLELALEG